jgi:hypothetical protein
MVRVGIRVSVWYLGTAEVGYRSSDVMRMLQFLGIYSDPSRASLSGCACAFSDPSPRGVFNAPTGASSRAVPGRPSSRGTSTTMVNSVSAAL